MDDITKLEQKIDRGFASLNKAVGSLSELVAVLTERVKNVRNDQLEFKDAMKELEETKKQVEKNTQFRKDAKRALWIILGVLLSAATVAAIIQTANALK